MEINKMMQIRKAKKEDLENLWEFEKENRYYDMNMLGEKFKPFFPWSVNNKEKNRWVNLIKKDLLNKNFLILVAEDEGKMLGYAIGEIYKFVGADGKQYIGSIEDFFVTRKARGRKISSKLMREILKWFKIKNVKNISLSVFAKNKKVVKIYERFGFEKFSIHMKKRLK